MAEYKLHCFAQSGNAYKAALALELAGADWEPLWVDFFKGAHRGDDYTAKNIMAEVPTLEHGGRSLSQSGAILEYLVEATGKFAPADRYEGLRWILWDNHKLTSFMATWRFMANFLPEEKRSADVIAFAKGRATAALDVLNRHLAGRDWIVGDALSIADLSCIGYFFYTDHYDYDWQQVPNVVAWRDRIAALPGWKHPNDLMPGS